MVRRGINRIRHLRLLMGTFFGRCKKYHSELDEIRRPREATNETNNYRVSHLHLARRDSNSKPVDLCLL